MQTTIETKTNATQQTKSDATPVVAGDAQVPVTDATPSAQSVYEAALATRNELRGQLDALVSQRHGLLRELEDHDVTGPATSGMQQRIVQLDARIAELDVQIAAADAAVAKTAAIPGAVVARPEVFRSGPPEEAFFIVPPLLLVLFLPIVIAWSRRIWRRSGTPPAPQLPSDLGDRLARLEAMGETTALEVERIGEGQRFVTRLLTERADRVLGEKV